MLYGDERDFDERKRLGVNVSPSFLRNARFEYSCLFNMQLSSRLPHGCSLLASLSVAPVLAGHCLSMCRASSSTTTRGMTSWHQLDQGIQVDASSANQSACSPGVEETLYGLTSSRHFSAQPRNWDNRFRWGLGSNCSMHRSWQGSARNRAVSARHWSANALVALN